MRVEFINPFIEAGMQIVKELIGGEIETGTLAVRSAIFTTQQISIVIGVSKQVEGYVLYGVSQVTATKIASALLGMPVVQMDEMATSALNELGNMISGHAASRLADQQIFCELSPPLMIRGINIEVASSIPALVIPLYTQCGEIDVNVALIERNK